MSIIQSIVLGLIQGLTEFIPVSSSAHLWLIPKVLGWESPTTMFILFLHIGTLIALLFFYRNLILRYIKSFFRYLKSRNTLTKDERTDTRMIGNIVIASVPAAIFGILLDSKIENFYDSANNEKIALLATTGALIIVGIIFIFANRLFTTKKFELEKLDNRGALFIGLSQVLALLRGVSRSGITLISGQLMGLKRVSAAEFAFLMSIPVIAGTSILGIYEFIKLPPEEMQRDIAPALIGMLVAFISGLIAIKFLIKFLKNNSLVGFGVYRILFAIAILLILFSV